MLSIGAIFLTFLLLRFLYCLRLTPSHPPPTASYQKQDDNQSHPTRKFSHNNNSPVGSTNKKVSTKNVIPSSSIRPCTPEKVRYCTVYTVNETGEALMLNKIFASIKQGFCKHYTGKVGKIGFFPA